MLTVTLGFALSMALLVKALGVAKRRTADLGLMSDHWVSALRASEQASPV